MVTSTKILNWQGTMQMGKLENSIASGAEKLLRFLYFCVLTRQTNGRERETRYIRASPLII